MRTLLPFLCGFLAAVALDVADIVTSVEHLRAPLGLETTIPRFSWFLASTAALPRSTVQSSYRLQVASAEASLTGDHEIGTVLWDSGTVASDKSNLVEFGAVDPLVRGGVYWWRVGVTYNSSVQVTWSMPARFSVGPDGAALAKEARFIGALGATKADCPWLRRSFQLPADALAAPDSVALVTVGSIGFHEVWVNGVKASLDVLSPPVSDLAKRVLLRTYDVTSLLKPGEENVLGLWLARGWADFASVNPSVQNLFNSSEGSAIAVAQLSLTSALSLGPEVLLTTDGTWRAQAVSDTSHLGHWKNSDFGGDRLDARLSQPLWANALFNDTAWDLAMTVNAPTGRLLSNDVSEPNRLRERVGAISITPIEGLLAHGSLGSFLVEMEQVFTGWVKLEGLKAREPNGTITIKASSVPVCGTAAAAKATAAGRPFCGHAPEYNMQHELIVNASGVGSFTPRFSYHEVHFLVLEGLAEAPALELVQGFRVGNIVTLSSNLGEADVAGRGIRARFQCSDDDLNRVYNTSMWTLANLVTGGMSVDCPHRERLGYLGDAHTSFETALQNLDSGAFYNKWLTDIVDIQDYPAHTGSLDPTGYIGHTAPTVDGGGGPSWSGFVITMPWQVYLTYGDMRMLTASAPAMDKLLDFWKRGRRDGDALYHDWGVVDGNVVDPWTFLGDWSTPHGNEKPPKGGTALPEAELFNNCYILYCTRIVADVSRVLGDAAAAEVHEADASALAAAIHTRWWNAANATYLDARQTHLVMPLVSGVVPTEHVEAVLASLRAEITTRQAGHIDTGLQGLYFMTKLLYDTSTPGSGGHDDLVHMMATAPTAPGYLDLLSKGFTTWPEYWGQCQGESDPQQPFKCAEGGAWTSGAQSPAHGTLNGLGQWFIAGVGGIRRSAGVAGFGQFELRPAFGVGGLEASKSSFLSTHGLIRSEWSLDASADLGLYNVTVPVNAEALVYLPAKSADFVRESGGVVASREGVSFLGTELHSSTGAKLVVFRVGSGQYSFSWPLGFSIAV